MLAPIYAQPRQLSISILYITTTDLPIYSDTICLNTHEMCCSIEDHQVVHLQLPKLRDLMINLRNPCISELPPSAYIHESNDNR